MIMCFNKGCNIAYSISNFDVLICTVHVYLNENMVHNKMVHLNTATSSILTYLHTYH